MAPAGAVAGADPKRPPRNTKKKGEMMKVEDTLDT